MTTPNPHSDKDNWEEKALPLCLIYQTGLGENSQYSCGLVFNISITLRM